MENSDSKKEFFLLCGVPSNGLSQSRIISVGETVNLQFPGTADFINQMPADIQQWRRIFLPIYSKRITVSGGPFFVNYMGDADCYPEALGQAIGIVDGLHLSCFNHPRSVNRLRRDTLRELFGHIDGLIIPKCISHTTQDISDFGKLVKSHELRYPVICRLAGTHGGKTQKLIATADDWRELEEFRWQGEKIYITEFVDYRDADGFYRKQRIAVVGGEVVPRHGCLNYGWSVSAENSPPETIEEEVQWNKSFFERDWPVLEGRVRQIIAETKLDYFGIDYSLRGDGKILLFEVTASMSMTRPFGMPTHGSIEYFPKMIQEKLAVLLKTPRDWLEYRGGGTSGN